MDIKLTLTGKCIAKDVISIEITCRYKCMNFSNIRQIRKNTQKVMFFTHYFLQMFWATCGPHTIPWIQSWPGWEACTHLWWWIGITRYPLLLHRLLTILTVFLFSFFYTKYIYSETVFRRKLPLSSLSWKSWRFIRGSHNTYLYILVMMHCVLC
jgi:hypothetical protein